MTGECYKANGERSGLRMRTWDSEGVLFTISFAVTNSGASPGCKQCSEAVLSSGGLRFNEPVDAYLCCVIMKAMAFSRKLFFLQSPELRGSSSKVNQGQILADAHGEKLSCSVPSNCNEIPAKVSNQGTVLEGDSGILKK